MIRECTAPQIVWIRMSDQRKSNRGLTEQRYSASKGGGMIWVALSVMLAASYCKGYFFFFIILSGFGENLLSHLSSTAVAGFAAAELLTKPNRRSTSDNNHSYILYGGVFMHFGSVGSLWLVFPLCALRPETGLPFHTFKLVKTLLASF